MNDNTADFTASPPPTASDRLAAPGPEHEWMHPLAGSWQVAMQVWPAPGAPPFELPRMTATRGFILGGRYLQETLMGAYGKPVRMATLGFNRLEGRFELTTVDSFEPGQMVYFGRGEHSARSIALHGESTEAGMSPEPSGRKRDLRFEITIDDVETNVQRIHVRYPGGQEYLFVEQRFTRQA